MRSSNELHAPNQRGARLGLAGALLIFVSAVAMPSRAAFTSGLISVDFNTSNSPTFSGAAVFGSPGDIWNGVPQPPALPVTVPLIKSDGAVSDVQLTIPNTGAFVSVLSVGPFGDLLRDGFQTNTKPNTFTLSGLTANASYDLVLYSFESALPNDTSFTVGGVTKHVVSDGVTWTPLIEGTNYASFTVNADAAGQLAITPDSNTTFGFDFNGLQIRPAASSSTVPLPAGLWAALTALLPCGAMTVAVRRRTTAPR